MRIEELLTMNETEVYSEIKRVLKDKGIPYEYQPGFFLVTKQHSTPCPLICVHVDTCNRIPPEKVVNTDGIVSLPPDSDSSCLGADDRAGVWIALEMIKRGTTTDFEYGFFDGEESGAIGSRAYKPKDDAYTCFIGLDRKANGGRNVATYGYDNTELISIFTNIGYKEQQGSFTDCSVLAERTGLACLNLSVGYANEHTKKETLNISQMKYTLFTMLGVVIPKKDYPDEYTTNGFSGWSSNYSLAYEPVCCDLCGDHTELYEYRGNQVCIMCIENF